MEADLDRNGVSQDQNAESEGSGLQVRVVSELGTFKGFLKIKPVHASGALSRTFGEQLAALLFSESYSSKEAN